jgi:DNA-binding PadR family transcriptional regulator
MEKPAIKSVIYGGINELMQNEKYYRYSHIGRNYCRWTEEGQKALNDFMNEMTFYIYEAEQKSLDDRSKDLLLKELKA